VDKVKETKDKLAAELALAKGTASIVAMLKRGGNAKISAKQLKKDAVLEAKTGWTPPSGYDDKTDAPRPTYENIKSGYHNLGFHAARDKFNERIWFSGNNVEEFCVGDITDIAEDMAADMFSEKLGFCPPQSLLRKVIVTDAETNAFNSVHHYFDRLAEHDWDGVPRLDTMLTYFLGAEDSPYVRAVSRKMICAAVQRALVPGCKFDHMPILDGAEGIKKSMFIRDLAEAVSPDFFSDQSLLGKTDQQQMENLEGIWFYEIAELTGMSVANLEHTKATITRQEDKARKAYGRNRTSVKRTCIFIGTSNGTDYMRGADEHRRFWPVGVKFYRREEFLVVRDQIFVEAIYRLSQGEKLWLEDELKPAHAEAIGSRRAENPFVDRLAGLSSGIVTVNGQQRVSNLSVENHLIEKHGFTAAQLIETKNAGLIRDAMRQLEWVKENKSMKIGKDSLRGYWRPESQGELAVGDVESGGKDEIPF
jgi:hypothetical protein